MKLRYVLIYLFGLLTGFFIANYYFDTDKIYKDGVEIGYKLRDTHILFVANVNYQKGWEDCIKAKTVKVSKR